VSNPLVVVVNVRRFGVGGLITIGGSRRRFLARRSFLSRCGFRLRSSSHGSVRRRRTVFWNVTSTYGMAAGLMVVVLRKGR
jgi:hypothetical protein